MKRPKLTVTDCVILAMLLAVAVTAHVLFTVQDFVKERWP